MKSVRTRGDVGRGGVVSKSLRQPIVALVILVLCEVAGAAQSAKFKTTWAAPGVGPLDFAGKKVAAVAITNDMNIRMSAEEAMAREITALGPVGVAAYRAIPIEELTNKDAAQRWFASTGVVAAITIRVVNVDKETQYSSVMFGTSYYQSFASYYDYGVATIVPIGSPKEKTTLAVETLLYDIANGGKLLWAGMSETTNPKDVGAFVQGLAKATVKDLLDRKLVRKKS